MFLRVSSRVGVDGTVLYSVVNVAVVSSAIVDYGNPAILSRRHSGAFVGKPIPTVRHSVNLSSFEVPDRENAKFVCSSPHARGSVIQLRWRHSGPPAVTSPSGHRTVQPRNAHWRLLFLFLLLLRVDIFGLRVGLGGRAVSRLAVLSLLWFCAGTVPHRRVCHQKLKKKKKVSRQT